MKRKATFWGDNGMLGILLFLFILIILVVIYMKGIKNADNVIDPKNCTGVCRGSCVFGEVQISSSCYIGGEIQKGKVCCATASSITNKDNEEPTQQETPPPPKEGESKLTGPSIVEVRFGDKMFEPVRAGRTLVLKAGETYKISVWAAGEKSLNCDVLFYKDSNLVSSGFLNGKAVSKALCVDASLATNDYVDSRKNIIVISLTPEVTDVGFFDTAFLVFNKDGVRMASETGIRISVTE